MQQDFLGFYIQFNAEEDNACDANANGVAQRFRMCQFRNPHLAARER